MAEVIESVWLGGIVRLGNHSENTATAPFTDADGDPTDPEAVTLTVARRDGTRKVYAYPAPGADGLLTRESEGRFYVDAVADVAGGWACRMLGTSGGAPLSYAAPFQWQIHVRAGNV